MLPGMVNPGGGVSVCERAMVATVTVTGAAAPFNETVLGVTVQVDVAGAPLHVSATL